MSHNGFNNQQADVVRARVACGALVLLVASLFQFERAIAAESEAGATLEEVTVTARRREESLQSVPIAVTVLTADFIAKNNLERPEELARLTPGFHYEQTGARFFNKPTIRGTSVNSIAFRLQKTSVYLDGIQVTGSFASLPFIDIKQVEVLKGPQSTAFGRGNLAGAISYVTKDPTAEFSGSLSLQRRTDKETHLESFVSMPLIADKLGGTVTVNYYDYGGPSGAINQLFGEQLGKESTRSVAGKLVGTPNDWLTVRARAFYAFDRDGLPTFQYINPADRTGNFTTPISLAASGFQTLAPVGPTTGSSLPYRAPTNQMDYPGLRRFTTRFSLSADMDLKFATLTAVVAKNRQDETQNYPANEGVAAPTILAAFDNPNPNPALRAPAPGGSSSQAIIVENYDDKQAELRLSSNGDSRLKYTVGANYFKFLNFENFTGFPFVNTYDTKNTGIFGIVSYKFTEKFTGSVEARQSRDQISQVGVGFGVTTPRSATYNRFVPRISANFQATPDLMFYGVVSKGNSPGSFNTNAGLHATAPQYDNVKEEILTNYELGMKSTWLDKRLLFNMTVYHMDWKDQQLLVVIPYPNPTFSATAPPGSLNSQQIIAGQFTANAGASKIDGIEVELEARPTEHLNLRGTLSYVNAKYKQFCSAQAWLLDPTPLPYVGYVGCKEVAGKTLVQQPPLTASILIGYEAPLTAQWKGFVNGDVSYLDKKYGSEVNLNWTPASTIVNLRLGAEHNGLRVELFGTNLTQETAPVRTRFAVGGAAFTGNYANNVFQQLIADFVPQKPRQFGVSATYNW